MRACFCGPRFRGDRAEAPQPAAKRGAVVVGAAIGRRAADAETAKRLCGFFAGELLAVEEQMELIMNNYHLNSSDASVIINKYLEKNVERMESTTQYGFLVSMKLIENKLFIEIT